MKNYIIMLHELKNKISIHFRFSFSLETQIIRILIDSDELRTYLEFKK